MKKKSVLYSALRIGDSFRLAEGCNIFEKVDGNGYVDAEGGPRVVHRMPDTQVVLVESISCSVVDPVLALGAPPSLPELYALWKRLGTIPTNRKDRIDAGFLQFEKGTPREDIWRWFEGRSRNFVVGEVMQGIYRAEDGSVLSKDKDAGCPPSGVESAPRSRCQNCDAVHEESALEDIRHYHQRVAPGEACPSGQCPDCGCLCHEISSETACV